MKDFIILELQFNDFPKETYTKRKWNVNRSIGREMTVLKQQLADKEDVSGKVTLQTIERVEKKLNEIKKKMGLINAK